MLSEAGGHCLCGSLPQQHDSETCLLSKANSTQMGGLGYINNLRWVVGVSQVGGTQLLAGTNMILPLPALSPEAETFHAGGAELSSGDGRCVEASPEL